MQYDCRLRFFLADPSAWPDGMASDMFLLVPLAFMRACAPWSCLGGVNSKQERAAGCRRPQMAMGMSASPVGHAQPQMAHTPSQRYESGSTLSVYLSDFLGQLSLSCMLIRNHVQYKRIWVPENISRWKTLLSMPTYLPRRLEYFRLQYIGYIFQLESHFNFIQTVSY